MLNPFDMLKVLQDPQFIALVHKVPEWVAQWERLVQSVRFLESAAQSADNRLAFIITQVDSANEKLTLLLSETHLTPDLHGEAVAWAGMDPRNNSVPSRTPV